MNRKALSIVRYVLVACLTAAGAWLERMNSVDLADVRWYSWAALVISVSVSGLNALGAVMNRSFSEAVKDEKPNGTTA